MKSYGGMNWRRGLLRLWIVGSLCWVVSVGWFAYKRERHIEAGAALTTLCEQDKIAQGGNPFACIGEWYYEPNIPMDTKRLIKDYAPWTVLPPLGVLIAGLLGYWVFAGFARNRIRDDAE